jgi:hypothetical protein
MFKALGFLIILWGLSHFFSGAFSALDSAAIQGFKTFEAATILSQDKIQEMK